MTGLVIQVVMRVSYFSRVVKNLINVYYQCWLIVCFFVTGNLRIYAIFEGKNGL